MQPYFPSAETQLSIINQTLKTQATLSVQGADTFVFLAGTRVTLIFYLKIVNNQ